MMMLLLLAIEGEAKFEKEKFSVRSEFSFWRIREVLRPIHDENRVQCVRRRRGGEKKIWEGEIFSTIGVQFLKNRGSPETNSWRGSSPMCEKKKKKIPIRRKIGLYRRETFWICVLQEWSAESVLGVHGDSKS
jgi:hypothetical protein